MLTDFSQAYEELNKDLKEIQYFKSQLEVLNGYKVQIQRPQSIERFKTIKDQCLKFIQGLNDAIELMETIIEIGSILAGITNRFVMFVDLGSLLITTYNWLAEESINEEVSKIVGDYVDRLQEIKSEFESEKQNIEEEQATRLANISFIQASLGEVDKLKQIGADVAAINMVIGNMTSVVKDVEDNVHMQNGRWEIRRDAIQDWIDHEMFQIQYDAYQAEVDAAKLQVEKNQAVLDDLTSETVRDAFEAYHQGLTELGISLIDVKNYTNDLMGSYGIDVNKPLGYGIQDENGNEVQIPDEVMKWLELVERIENQYGLDRGMFMTVTTQSLFDAAIEEAEQNLANSQAQLEAATKRRDDFWNLNKNQIPTESTLPEILNTLEEAAEGYRLQLENLDSILAGLDSNGVEKKYAMSRLRGMSISVDESDGLEDEKIAIENLKDTVLEQFANEQKNLLSNMGEKIALLQEGFERDIVDGYLEELINMIGDVPGSKTRVYNWLKQGLSRGLIQYMGSGEHFYLQLSRSGDEPPTLVENLEEKAEGTNFWMGGMVVLNERGDEIVELPDGKNIISEQEGRQMHSDLEDVQYLEENNVYIHENVDLDVVTAALVQKLELASLAMT